MENETPVARPPKPVEVWCASLHRWVGGFELVDTRGDENVVRRSSDGSVLPVTFRDDEVRNPTDAPAPGFTRR